MFLTSKMSGLTTLYKLNIFLYKYTTYHGFNSQQIEFVFEFLIILDSLKLEKYLKRKNVMKKEQY